ncbi:SDR family oxidoreductase [Rhodoligotrophos ferricapiens]|uniref:SDR family oxidoreductase n=1 Tax=Rhodoligotrophos ferricapiens TaxID=3069264 RepID=UPI00315CF2C7
MTGQRVMVTAAARGIGRAIALGFAAAGARVHICDVDDEALEEFRAEAPEIEAAYCDVTDEDDVDRWFADALDELGGLDVLVNNAGIAGPTAAVEDMSLDGWRHCVAVNLDSQFLCVRRAVPIMKQQGRGAIINMSSTAGLYGYGYRTPYASAKWAVIGFTKSLAVELGPHGIRVNAVCPGSVEGERMDRVIAAQARVSGLSEHEIRTDYAKQASLRRFVDPEEIADMVLFLASPQAAMVSGQAIAVDGHTETFR